MFFMVNLKSGVMIFSVNGGHWHEKLRECEEIEVLEYDTDGVHVLPDFIN
jgi:hypothetical protein